MHEVSHYLHSFYPSFFPSFFPFRVFIISDSAWRYIEILYIFLSSSMESRIKSKCLTTQNMLTFKLGVIVISGSMILYPRLYITCRIEPRLEIYDIYYMKYYVCDCY